MKIHQISVGNMQNFTYVLEDEKSGEGVVIDPSWDLDKIEEIIKRNNITIKFIINTHHHFDHTIGNEGMKKITGAKIIQHENSTLVHEKSVKDSDKIKFGSEELLVLHTPGHSKDSICLIGDGNIFSGDTLFVGNCGRVDLPGGSARELYESLFGKLYCLNDSLVLYPGHNYGHKPISTIGEQKETNFILQKRSLDEFLDMMGA